MASLVATMEERAGLLVAPIEEFRIFGLDAFVTSRHGGCSSGPFESLNLGDHVGDELRHVTANRQRVATAIGVSPDRLTFSHQVHGAEVATVTPGLATPTADALVTDADDVALAIMTADCIPLLIADSFSSTFAVVHAGWRGLAAGVLASTLSHFSDAATTSVYVGPHISVDRYQVGDEVAQHFTHIAGALHDDGRQSGVQKWRLHLGVVAQHQLRHAGVPTSQHYVDPRTTDESDLFFSDRASRPCGRFALVARRAPYDSDVKVAS